MDDSMFSPDDVLAAAVRHFFGEETN